MDWFQLFSTLLIQQIQQNLRSNKNEKNSWYL